MTFLKLQVFLSFVILGLFNARFYPKNRETKTIEFSPSMQKTNQLLINPWKKFTDKFVCINHLDFFLSFLMNIFLPCAPHFSYLVCVYFYLAACVVVCCASSCCSASAICVAVARSHRSSIRAAELTGSATIITVSATFAASSWPVTVHSWVAWVGIASTIHIWAISRTRDRSTFLADLQLNVQLLAWWILQVRVEDRLQRVKTN